MVCILPVDNKKVEIPCAENVCEVSPTYSGTLKFLTLFSVSFCALPTEMVYTEVPQS